MSTATCHEIVICVSGLGKTYRASVHALDGVDLRVGRGGITGLVGPNGAGKSTLLRTLVGFDRPTAGEVEVLGLNPQVARRDVLRRIGFVPQSAALYRELSVKDHVALAGGMRRDLDQGVVLARMADLQIPLSAKGGELSGGQRAQVALALALGTHAEVLLLDEPLADIDPLARREFLSVLRSTSRDSAMTVVLASHVVQDIQEVCDSIVVLGRGRVLLHAAVDWALANHSVVRGSYPPRAALVGAFPGPSGEVVALTRYLGAVYQTPTLEEVVLGYLASGRDAAGTVDGRR